MLAKMASDFLQQSGAILELQVQLHMAGNDVAALDLNLCCGEEFREELYGCQRKARKQEDIGKPRRPSAVHWPEQGISRDLGAGVAMSLPTLLVVSDASTFIYTSESLHTEASIGSVRGTRGYEAVLEVGLMTLYKDAQRVLAGSLNIPPFSPRAMLFSPSLPMILNSQPPEV